MQFANAAPQFTMPGMGIDVATLANIATALTVLVAAVFGLIEMRRARQDREERAAFAAVQALMRPEWMSSLVVVQSIPDGASAADIESNPQFLRAAENIGITLEAIGYAVYGRIVPLHVIDELVGGTVRVAARKLRAFTEYERKRSGSQKSWEWFMWLAEQLDRHSKSKTSLKVGAEVAYRDWKP